MNGSRGLRRVASGLELLQIGNGFGQAGILVWLLTGSVVWPRILGTISAVLVAAGFISCCWAPSLPMRLSAGLALVLSAAVLAVNLLYPDELAALSLALRCVINGLPLYALVVFLAALTDYCRRASPGEGQGVERCLSVLAGSAGLVLLAIFNGWHRDKSRLVTGALFAGAAVAVLALLGALGFAEKMARRVADSQDRTRENKESAT